MSSRATPLALPLTADCIDIMLRRMRDIETIDSEPRLVAALRYAARERGGPRPSIDVADALLMSTGS